MELCASTSLMVRGGPTLNNLAPLPILRSYSECVVAEFAILSPSVSSIIQWWEGRVRGRPCDKYRITLTQRRSLLSRCVVDRYILKQSPSSSLNQINHIRPQLLGIVIPVPVNLPERQRYLVPVFPAPRSHCLVCRSEFPKRTIMRRAGYSARWC